MRLEVRLMSRSVATRKTNREADCSTVTDSRREEVDEWMHGPAARAIGASESRRRCYDTVLTAMYHV